MFFLETYKAGRDRHENISSPWEFKEGVYTLIVWPTNNISTYNKTGSIGTSVFPIAGVNPALEAAPDRLPRALTLGDNTTTPMASRRPTPSRLWNIQGAASQVSPWKWGIGKKGPYLPRRRRSAWQVRSWIREREAPLLIHSLTTRRCKVLWRLAEDEVPVDLSMVGWHGRETCREYSYHQCCNSDDHTIGSFIMTFRSNRILDLGWNCSPNLFENVKCLSSLLVFCLWKWEPNFLVKWIKFCARILWRFCM